MQNDILPYFTHTADIYEEEATVKWLVETIKIVDIRFKISMQYTSTKKRFLLSHKSLYNIHQLFLYSIILYLSLHFSFNKFFAAREDSCTSVRTSL